MAEIDQLQLFARACKQGPDEGWLRSCLQALEKVTPEYVHKFVPQMVRVLHRITRDQTQSPNQQPVLAGPQRGRQATDAK